VSIRSDERVTRSDCSSGSAEEKVWGHRVQNSKREEFKKFKKFKELQEFEGTD